MESKCLRWVSALSNFHDEKLEHLLAECEIKPHVIQLEEHPYFSDTKTLEMLKPYGVKLMAWYPLGHGDKALLQEPIFSELSEKYVKTTAQIILRWHVQNGTAVIPGSTNSEHIRDNADIFNFSLTADEMERIQALNKNVRYYNSTPEMEERSRSFLSILKNWNMRSYRTIESCMPISRSICVKEKRPTFYSRYDCERHLRPRTEAALKYPGQLRKNRFDRK